MKMTIGKKLMGGFLIIAIILGLISFVAYYNLQKVDDTYSDLVNRRAVILTDTKDLQIAASREIAALNGVMLRQQAASGILSDAVREVNQKVNVIDEMVQPQAVKDQLKELEELNKQFKTASDQVIILMGSDQHKATIVATEKAIPLAQNIRNIADGIEHDLRKNMEEGSGAASNRSDAARNTVLILSIAAFFLAVLIGYVITRMINRPILSLEQAAKKISEGDLTQQNIKVKSKDEIANLAHSFNQMNENLRALIGQVGANADQVSVTSEELSASSEQTSKATELISAAIQEVAVGSNKQVENARELHHTVSGISSGMNKASSSMQAVAALTAAANDKAIMGHGVVSQTVEQINLIHQSVSSTSEVVNAVGKKSEEIGQIVDFITQIAEQTNLLALNAAIEAARAGDHGKGFAVVADEVRKLAEQSSKAAGNIRNLIQEVQTEAAKAVQSMTNGNEVVNGGIQLVHETGTAFNDILASIEQVTVEAQEVSSIVEEVNKQSLGMVEMMEGIAQIAEQSAGNTQNVAASAEEQTASMEEVSSSAETLSQMAQDLQQLVNKFKV
ncbi:methyl-accepting chemotaxis protein [Peribacillus sp. SCS-155]|uniref:methyl-accepting chemotaxis protein n=1 Tax=Peribacillus sedimenti TaxID=3115297 RepID=UPI0039062E83